MPHNLSLIVVVIAIVWSAMSVCAQDPAVVNSKTISIKFENERVRVLEATLPPGVEGGRYRNYAADGKITEGTFNTGDVIYRDPLTHAAENIGDKPMHLILVELKGASGKAD